MSNYFDGEDGDCRVVKIVDDLGFSESNPEQPITKATIAALQEAYGSVTHELSPTSFAGYKVERTVSKGICTVTLSQEKKVTEAARKYAPELLEGQTTHYMQGKTLEEALESLALPPQEERTAKLNDDQKKVQQVIGDLKYFERGTQPRLSRMIHRLSCIMSYPPPGALQCALGTLATAYVHRNECITFSGSSQPRNGVINDGRLQIDMSKGAPCELEVSADASTSPHDIYSVLVTYMGGAILHLSKKIGLAVASTHEAESVATVKASEHAVYARIVLAALGMPCEGPTLLLTDNLSNQKVCQNAQSAARSRYFLIRLACLHQRVSDGELNIVHIPDPQNPSDFLTKFIPTPKTNMSVQYASGQLAVIQAGRPTPVAASADRLRMQYSLWGEAQAGRNWNQDMAVYQRQIASHNTAMHGMRPSGSTDRSSNAAMAEANRKQDDGETELKALLATQHT